MTPKALLLAALLSLSALPLAAAQDAGDGETVWTEPRRVDDFVNVTPGSTLVVRGAELEVASGFIVSPGARLVLEEGTRVRSGDDNGWLMDVQGVLEVRGSADAPVVLDGLGGAGQNSGDTILFTGGIIVGGGEMHAQHLRIVNYTSGLKAAWNSTVRLEDVTFNSSRGLGLVASQGMIEGDRLTFRGKGATYWAVADGKAELRNATFSDPASWAVVVNGNHTVLRDVLIEATDVCLRNTVGRLEAYNLECRGYKQDGVIVSRPVKGFRLPEAAFDGLKVHTNADNASSAITVLKSPGHSFSNVEIGPTTKAGLVVDGALPRLDGLTFRGVGTYNVAILNPDRPVEQKQIGTGEPGEDGWLFVGFPVSARMLDPDGKPVSGVLFEGRYGNGSLAFRKVSPDSGLAASSYVPLFVVRADGTTESHTYKLQAYHPEKGTWSQESYVPDGQQLLVRLAGGPQGSGNPLPAPGVPLVLLGVLVAVAAAARLRRR